MDFETLELYIDVCNCSSISKAAAKNFMSKQALAKSMDRLENEIGVALLVRSRSGVAMTSAGKALLKGVESTSSDWHRLLTYVKNLSIGRKTLRIGCQMAMLSDDILRALLLDDALPNNINLVFMNEPKVKCWNLLHSGKIDIAYTLAPQDDSAIIEVETACPFDGAYLLMSESNVLSCEDIISGSSLSGQRVLVLNDPVNSNSHLIGYLSKAQAEIQFMPSTNSLLQQFLVENHGVLVVPGSALCQFISLGVLAKPLADFPPIMWQSLLRMRGCDAEIMIVAQRIAEILDNYQASKHFAVKENGTVYVSPSGSVSGANTFSLN